MAELSRATGVSVPMIKYYLREGLLAPGERTSPNQARYDDSHVRRIRLVRAMADYGGLSNAVIRDLLQRLDEPGLSLDARLGLAQRTVMPRREPGEGERWEAAACQARELIARQGWRQRPDSPAMLAITGVLAGLAELGYQGILDRLDAYAEAAALTAEADLDALAAEPNLERMVELVVAGTLLGDALVTALRRVAQSCASARRFGEEGEEGEEGAALRAAGE
ncbi:MerR family transcriptional regulator [Planomonospora sp. ID67723]|uniref:MerR family transcriptional regulator n=1 Tax=Planomonospora sp. ID67723 TaxID=2738134 RepID=UPI0018C39C0B|nr:MerR family transcriptional regulator [Planomonospora sp. ID67723]